MPRVWYEWTMGRLWVKYRLECFGGFGVGLFGSFFPFMLLAFLPYSLLTVGLFVPLNDPTHH